MADNINISQIQNIIGYFFKDDTALKTAFIHSSRAVYGEETNERLIFLGRRLFDVIVCDYIFSRSPYSRESQLEAQLEKYRSYNICNSYIIERKLEKNILVSEISNIYSDSKQVHREVFFAILGAIYRDGGMPSLKAFLLPLIRSCDGESAHTSTSYTRREKSYDTAPSVENEAKKYHPKSTIFEKNTVNNKKKSEVKELDDASEKIEESAKTEKKTFIRDALAPVRLPDSMRTKPNWKDRIPKKSSESPKESADSVDSENYKSKLQEFVQKNIRSANVLLKYKTYYTNSGCMKTEITLEDKLLAESEADNKRLSERLAAKNAYLALMDTKSRVYKDFCSLCEGEVGVPERKEDYISKLNQYYQRTEHESSAPISYERRYSTEKKTFCVALFHNDEELASAKGPTLKDARQNAAKKALEILGII